MGAGAPWAVERRGGSKRRMRPPAHHEGHRRGVAPSNGQTADQHQDYGRWYRGAQTEGEVSNEHYREQCAETGGIVQELLAQPATKGDCSNLQNQIHAVRNKVDGECATVADLQGLRRQVEGQRGVSCAACQDEIERLRKEMRSWGEEMRGSLATKKELELLSSNVVNDVKALNNADKFVLGKVEALVDEHYDVQIERLAERIEVVNSYAVNTPSLEQHDAVAGACTVHRARIETLSTLLEALADKLGKLEVKYDSSIGDLERQYERLEARNPQWWKHSEFSPESDQLVEVAAEADANVKARAERREQMRAVYDGNPLPGAQRVHEQYESVNHPPHYNSHPSGVECIDVVQDFSFNVGTAMKYLWRAGLKPGADAIEDLRKAAWYCEQERSRLTPESPQEDDGEA